ncbi:hypothetical protein E1298_44390 [Actinomadura rubrisoli]|uniref:Uncharacterized protein n=1 Tax=Actinomadura rubrisoli TaxID=2530368 RepID=A0A4R4ZWN9_9ACTN|nr:hypothetical protein E1298_44390 [Actinomadura rubrisoli]
MDFGRPVAIALLGVIWHIVDHTEAAAIADRLDD